MNRQDASSVLELKQERTADCRLQPSRVVIGSVVKANGGVVAADGKIVITFANWAAAEGTTKPSIDQVIADFEKAHPDIQIKSEAISFSEIARQLALRLKAGNPPDVAQLAGNDTFVIASTGKLEPLGGYVDADLKGRLKADAVNGLQYQGKLIALPWTLAPAGFWYNKQVMAKASLDPDKPPRTIDELMSAMATIKKSQPDVIPACARHDQQAIFTAVELAMDGNLRRNTARGEQRSSRFAGDEALSHMDARSRQKRLHRYGPQDR